MLSQNKNKKGKKSWGEEPVESLGVPWERTSGLSREKRVGSNSHGHQVERGSVQKELARGPMGKGHTKKLRHHLNQTRRDWELLWGRCVGSVKWHTLVKENN